MASQANSSVIPSSDGARVRKAGKGEERGKGGLRHVLRPGEETSRISEERASFDFRQDISFGFHALGGSADCFEAIDR